MNYCWYKKLFWWHENQMLQEKKKQPTISHTKIILIRRKVKQLYTLKIFLKRILLDPSMLSQ